jgi:hypothetical protein
MSDPIQYDIPPRLRPENLPGPQLLKTRQGKLRQAAEEARREAEELSEVARLLGELADAEALIAEREDAIAEQNAAIEELIVLRDTYADTIAEKEVVIADVDLFLEDLDAWEASGDPFPETLRGRLGELRGRTGPPSVGPENGNGNGNGSPQGGPQ